MEPPPKRVKADGPHHTSDNNVGDNHDIPQGPAKRGGRPRGNWDVSGRYSLKCTSRYQPVDATDYTLDLYYEHDSPHTCMLFGFFEFPNLGLSRGVMRLCPRHVLDDTAQQEGAWPRLYTTDFDAACVLAEGVRPSSKSKEWFMRWRAEHVADGATRVVGGYERAQSQFIFKRDTATGLIHVTFAIVHESKHLLYEGSQLPNNPEAAQSAQDGGGPSRPASNQPGAVARVQADWQRLFDPGWEVRMLSDTDIEEERLGDYVASKGHNHWERPKTGAMIYARNKPGPNPGFRAGEDMSSKLIEERPAWAWDVTGKYHVTSPEFDAIVNGPDFSSPGGPGEHQHTPPADFQMTIWLENNRWHSKVGRQLWAEFTFGESKGAMRFCPGSVAKELARSDKLDMQSFEDACILESGVWPGAAQDEKGEIEWGMRWRGYNPCMGLLDGDSGKMTTIKFTCSPDGQLSFSGTLMYGVEKIMLIGQKHGPDGAERSGQAVTVTKAWRQYLPRAISLLDYMDFEEPE
ncbi:uncharacterized protein B0I36DRAFT_365872 [Microdochium trichocladiopsis]|uniref:Uncharacterized protein n=1 Tax=Microdochium trichocladiopsis TaxID=1682393 RepID=A0A9P8Y0J0_9PEZI|nr:uncharacterized protein B0I36DRAFT_365872 [Microdochium trichocladiopsis]KAH7026285.1 hypothetical protein B0I36DRAFT_365872 [Microdochium trichocladiopsis]